MQVRSAPRLERRHDQRRGGQRLHPDPRCTRRGAFAGRQRGERQRVWSPSDLAGLTPNTWPHRIIFVMGLAAGLCVAPVQRGFAIRGLQRRGINSWSGAVIATIPLLSALLASLPTLK